MYNYKRKISKNNKSILHDYIKVVINIKIPKISKIEISKNKSNQKNLLIEFSKEFTGRILF